MQMIFTQTRATYAGFCMYNVLRSIINVTILLSAAAGQSQDHVARRGLTRIVYDSGFSNPFHKVGLATV